MATETKEMLVATLMAILAACSAIVAQVYVIAKYLGVSLGNKLGDAIAPLPSGVSPFAPIAPVAAAPVAAAPVAVNVNTDPVKKIETLHGSERSTDLEIPAEVRIGRGVYSLIATTWDCIVGKYGRDGRSVVVFGAINTGNSLRLVVKSYVDGKAIRHYHTLDTSEIAINNVPEFCLISRVDGSRIAVQVPKVAVAPVDVAPVAVAKVQAPKVQAPKVQAPAGMVLCRRSFCAKPFDSALRSCPHCGAVNTSPVAPVAPVAVAPVAVAPVAVAPVPTICAPNGNDRFILVDVSKSKALRSAAGTVIGSRAGKPKGQQYLLAVRSGSYGSTVRAIFLPGNKQSFKKFAEEIESGAHPVG